MKQYVFGVAVLCIVAGLAYFGSHLPSNQLTWQTRSATVDQIIRHSNGHVSYGIVESDGSVSEISVASDCGIQVGQTIIYQVASDYEQIQLQGCHVIPSGT